MAKRKINPNLRYLHHCLKNGKRGAVLEGSSRSAKTWSSVDFIVYLCSTVEKDSTINIIKETYNSFKTTLYDDFNRRLPMYGIPSPFADRKEVSQFNLFGNKINLLGSDSESLAHGVGCDYFYVNEALDVSQKIFDQAEMRCRKFWWMDYNPKAAVHYVYKSVCSRADVGFIKTTYKDNPHLSIHEQNKIESYQPIVSTEVAKYFGADKSTKEMDKLLAVQKAKGYDIDRNLLNFNEDAIRELLRAKLNEFQGTANEYMWNVYGLGLRSAPEGVVFQHVKWIQEFPQDIEQIYYGSDIGKTNSPSTVVKLGVNGKNLYLQCAAYGPTPSTDDYAGMLKRAVGENHVSADSAEPGYISYARQAGINITPVRKFAGSIDYGISLLKKYTIHLVDCPEWRSEQSGYKYKEINGIRTDTPVDEHNHLWDAARYAALTNLRLDE